MNPDVPDLEPMLGAMLRVPLRAISQRIGTALGAAGFTELRSAHFAVFQHLEAEGSRVTDLAARAHMTKQSMGALVDDMEKWGYLERVPDPSDGRARIVRRTGRGWEVERIARRSLRDLEAEWEQRIGSERMQVFRDVLQALVSADDNGVSLGDANP